MVDKFAGDAQSTIVRLNYEQPDEALLVKCLVNNCEPYDSVADSREKTLSSSNRSIDESSSAKASDLTLVYPEDGASVLELGFLNRDSDAFHLEPRCVGGCMSS